MLIDLPEFIGPPRAGKTTLCDLLATRLRKAGRSIARITDRDEAGRIAVPPVDEGAFSLCLFSRLLDGIWRAKHDGADVVVCDRGPFDEQVWFEALYRAGRIDAAASRALQDAVRACQPTAGFRRALVYVDVPPEVSLARHAEAGEHAEYDKAVMNLGFLRCLRQEYHAVLETRVPAAGIPLLRLDGTRPVHELDAVVTGFLAKNGF